MDNVIALEQPTPDGAGHPRIGRLRSASRILAPVITAAFAAELLLNGVIMVCGAFFGGRLLSMGPDACYLGDPPSGLPGVVLFGSLPMLTQMAYAATLVMDTAPALFALFHLRGLLRQYAGGIVFAGGNSGHIKRIGCGLIGYALAPFFGHQLVLLAGHGVDMAWFHAVEVQALIVGAVLFVIAQVMEVGREIEQDRDGFV